MYALDTFRGTTAINAECAALYPTLPSDTAASAASQSADLNACQQIRTAAAAGQQAMFGVGIITGLLAAYFFWK